MFSKLGLIVAIWCFWGGTESPSAQPLVVVNPPTETTLHLNISPTAGQIVAPNADQIGLDQWDLPAEFTPFSSDGMGIRDWKSSRVKLPEGEYLATVGPIHCRKDPEGQYAYFSIDIEVPIKNGHLVVSSQSIPLAFVEKKLLLTEAREVVTFDPDNRTVTFNLGKNIFRYYLPNSVELEELRQEAQGYEAQGYEAF